MKGKNISKKKKRAFTLLEAVVTMGILAAISLVVLPSLLSGSNSADLNSVTQEIVNSAREAQSQSADQTANTSWGIHFSNSTNTPASYSIFTGNSYASGIVQSTHVLPSDLTFVSSTIPFGSSTDIVFSPISGVTSAQKTIEVEVTSNPSLISTITIGQTGQINEVETGVKSGNPNSSSGQNIWLADLYDNSTSTYLHNRVQEFNTAGTYLSQFGSSGTGNGQFGEVSPNSIAIDSSGNIWVTDPGDQPYNERVEEFSATGTYLSQFGSYGTGNGKFSYPEGIAIDSSGNIWVADTLNNRVEEFSATGTYLSKFGSGGTGNGKFDEPTNIAIDSSGNIWVADTLNNRVEEFSATGMYLSQFGSSGSGNGKFSYPEGIAIDYNGNIWVVDGHNDRVEEFSPTGVYLSQFGSYGSGNGQFGTTSHGSLPQGIAIDSSGDIWVADGDNARVEEFSPTGVYLSQFGSTGDGNGQFGEGGPGGIAIH